MEDRSASAWVFCANHAIGDQRSLNIFVDDMLKECVLQSSNSSCVKAMMAFPPSMEEAVSPGPLNLRTLQWSLIQLFNLLSMASMVPDRVRKLLVKSRHTPSEPSLDQQNINIYTDPNLRRTISRYFTLSTNETSRLMKLVQQRSTGTTKYTLTHLLSAAVLTVTNALIQGSPSSTEMSPSSSSSKTFRALTQRFLLSVGLRSFGSRSYLSDSTLKNPPGNINNLCLHFSLLRFHCTNKML